MREEREKEEVVSRRDGKDERASKKELEEIKMRQKGLESMC